MKCFYRLVYIYFIIGCFTFLSCTKVNKNKIGFLLPNLTDARYLKDTMYFNNKAKALNCEVEFAAAGNDAYLQEEQAYKMINEGIKVIVISAVNQNLAASIVRYANDNKVKIIAYERLIKNCKLDYLLTFDHEQVGRLQAKYALDHCPDGNYIIIGGDKRDRNAELINKGQLEILSPEIKSGKINIIYQTYIEDWSPEDACKEFERISRLTTNYINVVLSSNDGMAGEIIGNINKEEIRSNIIVTGLDADLSACKRIVTGKQSMTVYKPFKQLAEKAAQVAVEFLNNKKIDMTNGSVYNGKTNVPTCFFQPLSVDSTNMKETIIKDGFYSLSEVYNK